MVPPEIPGAAVDVPLGFSAAFVDEGAAAVEALPKSGFTADGALAVVAVVLLSPPNKPPVDVEADVAGAAGFDAAAPKRLAPAAVEDG